MNARATLWDFGARSLIMVCRKNKILFTANKVAFQQTVNEQLSAVCKSFVTGQMDSSND